MEQNYKYILAGGGLASATAAEAIRKTDSTGAILLIGAEAHAPYNRPPLSKKYLRGEAGVSDVAINPEEWYKSNRVELATKVKAIAVDAKSKTVALDSGLGVGYEKLLLATGSSPRTLNAPGADGPNVHLLRTWDDCDSLKKCIGKKIVLVGGGYIGVEVAASFLQSGGKAVIIDPASQLWSKFASPEYATFLKGKLEAAGAEIILGDSVTAINPNGVTTKGGKSINGDLVLVAIGVTPNLDLAIAAGLDVDEKRNGVLVNEFLETSAPDIYAAGDIAGFVDPVLGKRWRVEHWNNAFWHGEIAGANMAGVRTPYDHVANFFSDELDIHFELFGDPQGGKGGLFHGEPSSNRFDEIYVNDSGQAVMVISVNPPDDLFETLDKIPREKPMVRGRESEIRNANFDLKQLLS